MGRGSYKQVSWLAGLATKEPPYHDQFGGWLDLPEQTESRKERQKTGVDFSCLAPAFSSSLRLILFSFQCTNLFYLFCFGTTSTGGHTTLLGCILVIYVFILSRYLLRLAGLPVLFFSSVCTNSMCRFAQA